ncbi:hypothetical protein [Nocardia higoensis]|uniref:hypothetical protein n=1 Tax=Nocardia higoensis TaxID=228599 RepID=UPI003A5CF3D0
MKHLDVSGLVGVSARATGIADSIIKASDSMYAVIHDELEWHGDSALSARARADSERNQMRALASAYDGLSDACAGAMRDLEYPINEIKTILSIYAVPPVSVSDSWDVSGLEDWDSEAGIQLARLRGLVDALMTADARWSAKIEEANNLLSALAPESVIEASTIAIQEAKTADIRADPDRMRTSAAAFQQMFGRAPSSSADWATAEVLNPKSYDPKYQGVGPEIRVVRINPVPGQGVVRVGQYIEQRDVSNPTNGLTSFNPFARDFGDDRTAESNFDPEHSRVTTYVDYENGLVVMRQNPSVAQDEDGGYGEVKVQAPEGTVWQNSDGSVRIQYEAGNPFAPPLSSELGDHSATVNGDLVFTPTTEGVEIDGTRTDYPSLEAYQDFPNGDSRTIVIDPAAAGNSLGPAVNLPFHHDVGSRGGEAFYDFVEPDGWNLEYDVPVPGGPKPSSPLGTTENPPVVPTESLPEGVA